MFYTDTVECLMVLISEILKVYHIQMYKLQALNWLFLRKRKEPLKRSYLFIPYTEWTISGLYPSNIWASLIWFYHFLNLLSRQRVEDNYTPLALNHGYFLFNRHYCLHEQSVFCQGESFLNWRPNWQRYNRIVYEVKNSFF